MKYTELGRKIAGRRKSVYLTQKALAKLSGLHMASIQKLEQGVTENPSLDTLRRIAAAMDVFMIDLLPNEDRGLGQAEIVEDWPPNAQARYTRQERTRKRKQF